MNWFRAKNGSSRPRNGEKRGAERSGQPLPHWKEIGPLLTTAAAAAVDKEGNTIETTTTRTSSSTVETTPLDYWQEHLTAREYNVLFQNGTEPARSSSYDKFYPRHGHFACRACGLPLYSVDAKFDAGTGWPSFGSHVQGNVVTSPDYQLAPTGKRTALSCARCQGHLGHVFAYSLSQNWFRERQCINGVSISYVKEPLANGTNGEASALATY